MELLKQAAHFFTGCGGSVYGMELAGWHGRFAVEVDPDRCQTLKHNFPDMHVFEGPIQHLTLKDYPETYYPVHVYTYPCKNYTYGANVHGHWNGDSLYLEALREAIMLWPEVIWIENVKGMRQFPRVMETWRSLPHYYCTELELHGEDFTHQRKSRVFLILHRQAYDFPAFDTYIQPPTRTRLTEYLEPQMQIPLLAPYILKRIDGGYRDPAIIYDPQQHTPVNLFANYKRDRSNYLVKDATVTGGARPFTVREVARLHGFPDHFTFRGGLNSQYAQIIDAVMPPMAEAIGHALNGYFEAISSLAPQPQALGHRTASFHKHLPAQLSFWSGT
jgi:DNA (cytosine-5)-methyltransferase 1